MIDPQQRAREHLRPDEHLYWAGTSDPGKLFTGRDAFLVPFSLVWCGFAVVWTVTAASSGAPPFFLVFGSVFTLVGLYFVAGRFLVKRYRKQHTVYAVTDRRALVISPRDTREVPVGRSDRTVTWTADRRHCSVEWEVGEPSAKAMFFGAGAQTKYYANSGLDGVIGPQTMAFWDVTDGEELVRELERAAR